MKITRNFKIVLVVAFLLIVGSIVAVSLLTNVPEIVSSYKSQEDDAQSIINIFDQNLATYRIALAAYPEINTSFVPQATQVDSQTKIDPVNFWTDLKTQFKQAVITYNQTAATPLRWEIDPTLEVSTLSSSEKAAMLLGFAFNGTTISTDQDFLSTKHPGSVILFGDNIENADQTSQLTAAIQRTNPKYPVLINTDQEGGEVARITWDSTISLKEIDALSSDAQCAAWRHRADVLSDIGINWNLGIIADVSQDSNSFIYPRTFSNDYQKAATDVATAVNCSPTVLSTIKHYPGHGGTSVDTHHQIGTLNVSSEAEWLNSDAIPFQAGLNADSIMMGQLVMSWLDTKPASISAAQINYLRENLGYEGLIVTDDMMMLSEDGYPIGEAVKQAMLAGDDMVLVTVADDRRDELIQMVTDMINSGELNQADINNRIARIFTADNKIIDSYAKFIPRELVY